MSTNEAGERESTEVSNRHNCTLIARADPSTAPCCLSFVYDMSTRLWVGGLEAGIAERDLEDEVRIGCAATI